MLDLLKTAGLLYLIFSAMLAIIFFSKADVNIILLITVPIGIVFQGMIVLIICFALSRIIENLNSLKGSGGFGESV
jgi:uncharacterized membrane protein